MHNTAIICADLSLDKKKLAIVDENKNLTVIDLVSKEIIQSEMNVMAVSWNTHFNDLLAYSGKDMIFIKASNHPALS